jgi:CRP/FNR family cyclic AMP-dependent transcriptional regulator
MLGRDVKVEMISRVPLFAGCSKGELRQIARIADEIDLRAGKVLCKQGTVGREFFVLLEGTVDVSRDGRSIDTIEGGGFFGEIALVSDAPRNATVTATTPLRVLVIVDREFRELLRSSPQISSKVLAALAGRLAPESKI